MDVRGNRKARKWTRLELLGRAGWWVIHPLFIFSPRPLWVWRRLLLRLFGATIGTDVRIFPTARIAIPWNIIVGNESAIGDRAILYSLGIIRIGDRVTISQGAHLCAGTHDWRKPDMPLIKSPITVLDDAWICADAFIGPGVTVGPRAIVGARAVAMKDIPSSAIVMGNPAMMIGSRDK